MPQEPESLRETLTKDDLGRIFIRAQKDDSAEWVNISVEKASNIQFDTWARSRIPIQGGNGPWLPEERAAFCDQLYQVGALVVAVKGAFD
ncbi:MAG TPA: hypothetical protein VHV10_02885 [Ktedonobacteraceae bacterium]|jgi:hypothetical protein|nr:hypothetical protein [Ktedonobacteraceae bacterium]